MSVEDRAARWASLAARDLVRGDMPPAEPGGAPWYVRLVLGIAGWIGALFLFLFLGAGFRSLVDEPVAAITVGGLLCAGGWVMLRRPFGNDFVSQFSLAVSITGQALLLLGLARAFESTRLTTAWTMALVQASLFALVPNSLHRVWTAGTGAFLVAWGFGELGLFSITPALLGAAFGAVWLREFAVPTRGEPMRSAAYGLAAAAAAAAVIPFEWRPGTTSAGPAGAWAGVILSSALLPWIAVQLLRREDVPLGSDRGKAALASAAILGVSAWWAPGIGPGIAILLLGFANGHAVLAGFGLLALIAYLVRFYYVLDVTLLVKSALLAGTGVGLLLARGAVLRAWPAGAPEEPRRA